MLGYLTTPTYELLSQTKLFLASSKCATYAEIKHSDWMFLVT